jgi:Domain of unknown function (DUF4157)
VLGAGPAAAPSGGFDPSAALIPTPPPPTPVAATESPAVGPVAQRRATSARMQPPAGPVRRTAGAAAPEARWRAAVAARPLESPRPFPVGLRPLVAAVTGAERATYTTGPATREALAAAGAHGATTGSVVHLPAAPTAAAGPLLGVVAHELAHARRPVTRPRFLLEGSHGGGDDDERSALALGRRFGGATAGDDVRAGIVEELPVGGLGRVTGALGQARDAVSDTVPDGGGEFVSGGGPGWPGAGMPGADLGGMAGGAASAAMGAVGSVVDSAGGTAGHADGTPGGAPPPSTVDIDRLADLLEQRLLRQIERRGGRYAGVF